MLDSEQTKREKIKEFRLLTDVPDHHDTEAFLLQRGWNLQRALNDFFDANRNIEEIPPLPLAGSFTNSSLSPSSASGTRTRHYQTVRSRVVTNNSSSIWQRIEENRTPTRRRAPSPPRNRPPQRSFVTDQYPTHPPPPRTTSINQDRPKRQAPPPPIQRSSDTIGLDHTPVSSRTSQERDTNPARSDVNPTPASPATLQRHPTLNKKQQNLALKVVKNFSNRPKRQAPEAPDEPPEVDEKVELESKKKELKELEEKLEGLLTCSICCGDMERKAALQDCGHVFCVDCCQRFYSAFRRECPICRKSFNDYIQLFM
ncbi:Oidioi.mRNA.OKI2018_I69.PAR.g9079.t1.cds [Oikopleura dioica]|uniref:Oidioi.mRNA.OKI2018_I69.PAR.g9079.t1.cds n=1 Tax=Oikopleura dioica TaxID=34765 RepID=A0ABN7RRI3_OIKDI|nr:Oidioi.mRNA.OKI2018_I69.PAR.g9079.t1.cds [Oikopleura dioica]